MINFTIAVVTLIILSLILCLHYTQHFKLAIKCLARPMIYPSGARNSALQRQIDRLSRVKAISTKLNLCTSPHIQTSCSGACCKFLSIDGEDFDFFPKSFLYYVIFVMLLTMLIIVSEILSCSDKKTHRLSYDSYALSQLHHMQTAQNFDYVLIYGFMVLCVWQSLFSFYRYYSTLYGTQKLESFSMRKLFQIFRIYAIIFCAVYVITIHVYYYLLPAVIITFASFNCYCLYKFAAMVTGCRSFASLSIF